MNNSIEFKVWGRYALFTDPATKIGGEKCSYHVPTYEAIKGIIKSIYWKPTLIWHVDKIRVMKRIRTQTKGAKPLVFGGGNSLAIYTYLADVEYQVLAHFEWNLNRPELINDRIDGKHFQIAKRSLEKGGRQDIFLGTRECQGYVEPCRFGDGIGDYDDLDELTFSTMFMGFQYPDEFGGKTMKSAFHSPVMRSGIIEFPRLEECRLVKEIREFEPKRFNEGVNFIGVDTEVLG
jgi:CRISPR-associated protein Cas5d